LNRPPAGNQTANYGSAIEKLCRISARIQREGLSKGSRDRFAEELGFIALRAGVFTLPGKLRQPLCEHQIDVKEVVS
jgi:hypothetical protein